MSDSFETWQDCAELGRGGFGTVKKVITDRGVILAAKYINQLADTTQTAAVRSTEHEVGMLKQMSHENIVRFVAIKMLNNQMVVFTELIDGKSLKTHSPVTDKKSVQGFIKQICAGLHYMHSRNPPVLHRDIKGENIMVTHDGIVKLIDFGLALNFMVASGMNATQIILTTTGNCGTLPFMAPELLKERSQFSVKSDVWALGMTIYEMVSGKYPFDECIQDTQKLVTRITDQGAPALPNWSPELLDFYACCTRHEPGDRMSVRQLLGHRYLAG